MSALERYNEIFCNTFEVTEDELNEDFTFKDIEQWNSLAHLSLVGELEDEFDIMLETDDILHFGSYENGKKILARLGVDI